MPRGKKKVPARDGAEKNAWAEWQMPQWWMRMKTSRPAGFRRWTLCVRSTPDVSKAERVVAVYGVSTTAGWEGACGGERLPRTTQRKCYLPPILVQQPLTFISGHCNSQCSSPTREGGR